MTEITQRYCDPTGIDAESKHYYSEYIGNHTYIVVRRADQCVMATYTARNLARGRAIRRIKKLEAAAIQCRDEMLHSDAQQH